MISYLMIFVLIANLIAILLVYYSFGKDIDKSKKFMNTMITIGAIYILVLIIYSLSSIGIEQKIISSTAKSMLIMSIVPVNTIIFAPFLIHSYMSIKSKKIDIQKFKIRVIIVGIIAVITMIYEFNYFKNTQNNLKMQYNNLINNSTNSIEDITNLSVFNNEINTEKNNNILNNNVNNFANNVNNVVNNIANNSISNTINKK